MKRAVFDIESDGFLNVVSKIHCLSYYDIDTRESKTLFTKKEIKDFVESYDVLIGHNIIRYDLPVLAKFGIHFKGRAIDTLGLAWYLFPNWIRYGLEAIGQRYGIPKPVVTDWEGLTSEEYAHRCEEDVRINSRFWAECEDYLSSLYNSKSASNRLINYISFKLDCIRSQEALKWKVDVPFATKWAATLTEEVEVARADLSLAMPESVSYTTKKKPSKMFLVSGKPSAAGIAWTELLAANPQLPPDVSSIEVESSREPANPNSVQQMKDWLFSLGWEPCTFSYVKNKETGDTRAIPQVYSKEIPGQVSASVLKLVSKAPEIELLNDLTIKSHRLSILTGFLNSVDENGYVEATIGGLTNTLRFKHRAPLVNLPKPSRAYGEVVRGSLICEEGEVLVGSDVSSLEDQTKRHYIYPHDPEYVDAMRTEGFDSHLDLALRAGFVTDKEVEAYGNDTLEPSEKGRIKSIRDMFKPVNYAGLYGAGAPTVSRDTGMDEDDCRKLLEMYWERNWAVKKVAEDSEVISVNGQLWLFNPVSKFYYSLRYEKDRFSTLNQSTGVYCFDTWVKFIREDKKFDNIIAQFHDEVVGRFKVGMEDEVRNHFARSMERANEALKLNVTLDMTVDFGSSYAQIH